MCLALHHLVVTATGVRIRAGQQQRCSCQQDRRHPTTSPEHAARAVCGDRYCRGLREEEKRAEGTWYNSAIVLQKVINLMILVRKVVLGRRTRFQITPYVYRMPYTHTFGKVP